MRTNVTVTWCVALKCHISHLHAITEHFLHREIIKPTCLLFWKVVN